MDKLVSSLPPLPLILNGTDSTNKRKLIRPPGQEVVIRAAEAFAPKYDAWMKAHHAIACGIVSGYEDAGRIGNVVAEVGCGTARLTIELILKRMQGVFTGLAKAGVVDPATYICLDLSRPMLALAKGNVYRSLLAAKDLADSAEPPLQKELFEIRDESHRLEFRYNGQTVLNALFACADAANLTGVVDKCEACPPVDAVILSYVMHWFRGYQGKLDVLRALSQELHPGSNIISIEEYPLVVRCDLHPDDPEIQELARLIHRATSVVPLAHIEAIYRHAGFVPVCEADTDVRIDVYHSMYGKVFTKPATDSKPTTD